MRKLFASLLLSLAAAGAAASDAALEKRAKALSEELRCLVCQNQTIADSNAELAVDLRKQVREQLAQGKSDEQVIDYMVGRYGDFVLYRPPVKETTWLLWFGPLLLLVGGVVALAFKLAKPRPQQPGLASAELARAESLLDNKEGPR